MLRRSILTVLGPPVSALALSVASLAGCNAPGVVEGTGGKAGTGEGQGSGGATSSSSGAWGTGGCRGGQTSASTSVSSGAQGSGSGGGAPADGGEPDGGSSGAQGAGATTGTGGTSGSSSGAPGTGGAPSDGGTPGTGGAPSDGGTPGTGGSPLDGGTPGTGGAPTDGGSSGSGNATPDAGTQGTGGGPVIQPLPPVGGPLAYTAGFIVHVHPSAGTVTVESTAPQPPGNDAFATATAAPPGTFELVGSALGTDGQCPPGFQTSSVCFDVRLTHGLPRSLSNVFAQVVSITDPATGLPPVNAGALGYDASEHGLAPTRGLWKYTAAAATTPGVLGEAPDDSAARTWIYASAKHHDVDLGVRVVASLGYSKYVFDYSSHPFVDACAGGVDLGQPAVSALTLPFPFSFYGVTTSTVMATARGTITLAPLAPTTSATNVALPSALGPWASVFAFWDDLVYGGAGSALCARTLGAAPNRSFVVTWKDVGFASAPDAGAHLTFSAVLAEGSSKIDVVYGQMTGPTPRAHGASATVGVQNECQTVAAGEFNTADFGTGEAFSFNPYP